MALVLQRDWAIVCEGYADKEFFRHLIRARTLPEFDIPFPQEPGDIEGQQVLAGRSDFGKMLQVLRANFALKGLPRAVLLVADSGDDPAAVFAEIRSSIAGVAGYAPPDHLLTPGRSATAPDLLVVTVPWINQPGSLETLCLIHLATKHAAIAPHVAEFCQRTGVSAWTAEKRDKARLQCFIAATNTEDPNKSLRYAFSGANPIISVNDACFDQIAQLLANFANYLA